MGMVEKEKKHGDPFNFAPQVNMQKWVIISAMTLWTYVGNMGNYMFHMGILTSRRLHWEHILK